MSEMTSEKCVLSWLPPLDDGGAKIEYYVVQKRETSRLAWTKRSLRSPTNKTEEVTKLLKNVANTYSV